MIPRYWLCNMFLMRISWKRPSNVHYQASESIPLTVSRTKKDPGSAFFFVDCQQ
jgi:hypothetical protein